MNIKSFYKSDRWRNLLANLKLQRVDEKGQLICEHCGLPIVRSYDCIGHHKVALTADNVDDVNISLNPDNIALIHLKCHNEIHERFNGRVGQKVYLVYGAPCSGKHSWVYENANDDDLILSMDRLWSAVCKEGKPRRLTANVFGLRDCMIDMIRTRKGMWRNAYVIGGYPLRSERDRLCDLLDAEPVYIESSKEDCIKKDESKKEFIEEWFSSYTE